MKRILYLGEYQFPDGDAGAVRVLGIGQALRTVGYDVTYIIARVASNHEEYVQPDGNYVHNGFGFIPLRFSDRYSTSRLNRVFDHLTGMTTLEWLEQADLSNVSAIIAYHGSSIFLYRLIKFCAMRKIALIADCTEWYHSMHIMGGPLSPLSIDSELRMRYIYPKFKAMIAISSYLENQYGHRGVQTLRIPTLLDIKQITPRLICDCIMPIVIAYTGTPGKKDLLDTLIAVIYRLDPKGERIKLRIAGPHPNDILKYPALRKLRLKLMPPCIDAVGRVPREDALNIVRDADYTVLLRSQQRYAQAGFPTKFAESMSVGTPVICNLTSDLALYITDGVEGLICNDITMEAITVVVKRALSLSLSERTKMRQASRSQAEQSFDYHPYARSLKQLLENSSK